MQLKHAKLDPLPTTPPACEMGRNACRRKADKITCAAGRGDFTAGQTDFVGGADTVGMGCPSLLQLQTGRPARDAYQQSAGGR
ncbi:hypothetical protein SPHINGOT1_270107 [Sphingomonas sp. T1]|nr:hypothetical protein SPHINGOT1_270107 [Sphingomonas sp. T1]